MENSLYQINFEKLCEKIHLGDLQKKQKQIYGGLLHKMFEIETTKGHYAVKALNPQIMLRDAAMENYIFSEKVVNIAYENGINALPAIAVDGKCIHEVDGQFYLVFPWFNGKTATPNSVDISKCLIIGELLAKIHNLDFSSVSNAMKSDLTAPSICWSHYLEIAKMQRVEWLDSFSENLNNLTKLEEQANKSCQRLSQNSVISHRDLDQKNVLWDDNDAPMIIDWEAAGYINPSSDLLDVALYWSGGEIGTPNEQAFNQIIQSYCKNGGTIKNDLKDVLNSSFIGKLGWLEYSIKRSLRIECSDDDEQILGTNEVTTTLQLIEHHINIIPILFKWLSNYKV